MGAEPSLLDVVELLVDLPERAPRAGDRGTMVDADPDETLEIAFVTADGETFARALSPPISSSWSGGLRNGHGGGLLSR